MTTVAANLRASTLISVAISMAISAGFFLLVFGRDPHITLFAPDGLALDFVPQTLAAGFMAALVPALQTHAKIKAGTLPGSNSSARAILGRAIMLALAGLLLAAAVTAILWLGKVQALSWSGALALKIIYGGLLGLIITPVALRALFSRG